MQNKTHWLLLALILAFGLWARLWRLESLPPGLYTDEAFYALDAVDVIDGARPIYFPANNGREPLFMYLLAGSIQLLGHTPLAVRLPAAILGSLTVLAAYGLGRTLFNPRIGLMVAAFTAGSLWAIALSRIGLRANTLPPLAALMIVAAVQAWRAHQTHSTRKAQWLTVFAGVLFGLCFYTYIAARLIPLSCVAIGLFWYIAKRSSFPTTRWLVAFAVPALLVIMPLAVFALQNPAVYFGRVEQVSVIDQGARSLFDNLFAVLGMFIWQGDLNARHNLPGRPVFDWVLGALFWSGVALATYRGWAKRELACVLALVWLATMLLPTWLSNEAPHFLRAIGAIPIVFIFPALALEWLWNRTNRLGQGVISLVLSGSVLFSAATYFTTYAQDERVPFYFQSALTTLAQESNSYLAEPKQQLYLDAQLWEKFPALRFLIGARPNLNLINPEAAATPLNAEAARLVLRPTFGTAVALAAWPAPTRFKNEVGAFYRNDNEAETYPLYTTFTRQPLLTSHQPLANFGAVQLLAVQATPTEKGYAVTLTWAATQPINEDLHIFVHLKDGEAMVAQSDNGLGGLYAAPQWRPGDQVEQTELITVAEELHPARLRLVMGLYRYPSGERLLTGTQDAVELPMLNVLPK
ncbi:MAG: glycosyltransferase family 39 protein [Anaerolineales bacterium]|nr:glycosyltransferase family 39 protein [Anaerolineales bacterium]